MASLRKRASASDILARPRSTLGAVRLRPGIEPEDAAVHCTTATGPSLKDRSSPPPTRPDARLMDSPASMEKASAPAVHVARKHAVGKKSPPRTKPASPGADGDETGWGLPFSFATPIVKLTRKALQTFLEDMTTPEMRALYSGDAAARIPLDTAPYACRRPVDVIEASPRPLAPLQPPQRPPVESLVDSLRRDLAESRAECAGLRAAADALSRDLQLTTAKCLQLGAHNRALGEMTTGAPPVLPSADHDLLGAQMRAQMEALLAEKARLARDNARLARENTSLAELLSYHCVESDEEEDDVDGYMGDALARPAQDTDNDGPDADLDCGEQSESFGSDARRECASICA